MGHKRLTPPADVLALLPTTDIAGAAAALSEDTEKFQLLVGLSNCITIMPLVDGIAFPAFAKSAHDILVPDVEGAVAWAEYLGLPYARSETAGLFGEVLSISRELGSLEQKGFGKESGPDPEVFVRRRLSSAFDTKNEELARRIEALNLDLRTEVSSLIEKLRTGDIDFVEEALAATGGDSTETSKKASDLTMVFIESEWLARKQ